MVTGIGSHINSVPFWVRDACMDDLPAVLRLGQILNTVNLPADVKALEQVIGHSEASFSHQIMEPPKREFLFVLVNARNEVIGSSQVIAKHGTLEKPHIYFEVCKDERYSPSIDQYFSHQVLRLGFDYHGPSEIGSLVVEPRFRQSAEKVGRLVSFARFLLMALYPHHFSERVIAELLPPFHSKGDSPLWEALGSRFSGLSYVEADLLSRHNKEFIKNLWPREVYMNLLTPEAQSVIGQVGPSSKAAGHLLSKIGFYYSGKVDPFDGGPHFEAYQKEILLLRHSRMGSAGSDKGNRLMDDTEARNGLVGFHEPKAPSGKRFYAIPSRYIYADETLQIILPDAACHALERGPAGQICAIPLM